MKILRTIQKFFKKKDKKKELIDWINSLNFENLSMIMVLPEYSIFHIKEYPK